MLAEGPAAIVSTERDSGVISEARRGLHKPGLSALVGEPHHHKLMQVNSDREAPTAGKREERAVLAGGEAKLDLPRTAARKLHCPPVYPNFPKTARRDAPGGAGERGEHEWPVGGVNWDAFPIGRGGSHLKRPHHRG